MTYCNHSNQKKYPFVLPELPYGKDEFKPHFTAETFDYHYNKHHNAYVTNLNNLIQDNKEMIEMDLESIILGSKNFSCGLPSAVRFNRMPKKTMIPYLCRIIKNSCI